MPALRREALAVSLGVEGDRRRAVDRDVIVVVADDQLAQPEVARDRRRFLADPLHQIAVRADHVRAMVDDLAARPVEELREVALRDREPDRVSETLPER